MVSNNRHFSAFLNIFYCLFVGTLVTTVITTQVSADIIAQWPDKEPFESCVYGSVLPIVRPISPGGLYSAHYDESQFSFALGGAIIMEESTTLLPVAYSGYSIEKGAFIADSIVIEDEGIYLVEFEYDWALRHWLSIALYQGFTYNYVRRRESAFVVGTNSDYMWLSDTFTLSNYYDELPGNLLNIAIAATGLTVPNLLKNLCTFISAAYTNKDPNLEKSDVSNTLSAAVYCKKGETLTWCFSSYCEQGLSMGGIFFEHGSLQKETVLRRIKITGPLETQDVELSSDAPDGQLDFGQCNIGDWAEHAITITNHEYGQAQAQVTVGEGFSISPSTFELNPGESKQVIVSFEPQEQKIYDSFVEFSAQSESLKIPITGVAINPYSGNDISLSIWADNANQYIAGQEIYYDADIHNSGQFSTGNICVGFIVTGPADYYYEDAVELGPIAPGSTADWTLTWPIPSNAQEGLYRLQCEATNEKGDQDISDNLSLRQFNIYTTQPQGAENGKVACTVNAYWDDTWAFPGHDPPIPSPPYFGAYVGNFDIGDDHYVTAIGVGDADGVSLDLYKNGFLVYTGLQPDYEDSEMLPFNRSHYFPDNEYRHLMFTCIEEWFSGSGNYYRWRVAIPSDTSLPCVSGESTFYAGEAGNLWLSVPTSKYKDPMYYLTTEGNLPQIKCDEPISWITPGGSDYQSQEVSEIQFNVTPPSTGTYDLVIELEPKDSPLPRTYTFHTLNAQQAKGSLYVSISPFGAIDTGAQWKLTSETIWHNSSETVSYPFGTYTLEFKDITNWYKPDNETVQIINNQTTTTSGTYTSKPSINQAPLLQAIGNKSVNENTTLIFDVDATDPDGDTVTYSAGTLPSGAAFIGQTFTWTPSYDQAGSYQVTFIASDGQLQDSETITITVNNVNRTPVLGAIANQSVNENSLLSFSVNATDPDGQSLTYSVSGLPAGAVFASQTLTWTPSYAQAGSYPVTFTADDGQAQDSKTITITVNNVNRPPVLIAIGNQSVWADDPLTFTIDATDPDGDAVTYSAGNLPSGATFTGQDFDWTPSQGQMGSYDVTFLASDGQLQDSQTITVTVDTDPR